MRKRSQATRKIPIHPTGNTVLVADDPPTFPLPLAEHSPNLVAFEESWRRFLIDYLQERQFRIDSFMCLHEGAMLEPNRPAELIAEAITTLNSVANNLHKLHAELSKGWGDA